MGRYAYLKSQDGNDSIQFEVGGIYVEDGNLYWDVLFGTQQSSDLTLTDFTDISTFSFSSQISEMDTKAGESAVGIPERANGERREYLQTVGTGNTITITVSKHLGTTLGNDGTSTVIGPADGNKPENGKPVEYLSTIQMTNDGIGVAEEIDAFPIYIRLLYNSKEQE